MVYVMRYDDELVAERGCVTFFLQLIQKGKIWGSYDEQTKESQLNWFKQWDIPYELVAWRGLISGDSGRYYVGFSGWEDPLLKLWCKMFEDTDGNSLHPDKYVMHYYDMDMYNENKAKGLFEPDEIYVP